jgi:hypothetical protein
MHTNPPCKVRHINVHGVLLTGRDAVKEFTPFLGQIGHTHTHQHTHKYMQAYK